MRLHFLMSISVVLTHPGCRKKHPKENNVIASALFENADQVGGYNLTQTGSVYVRLTTGLWTSQKALSWLSRIFLSILSFFLSILQNRAVFFNNNEAQNRLSSQCTLASYTLSASTYCVTLCYSRYLSTSSFLISTFHFFQKEINLKIKNIHRELKKHLKLSNRLQE